MQTSSRARWLILLLSYAAAGVTFSVSNPDIFWNSDIAIYMSEIAGPVAGTAFAIWVLLIGWAFLRYGEFKWWFAIAAPFALWTPMRLLIYVLMYLVYILTR